MHFIRTGLWCAHTGFTAPSVLAGMVSPAGVVDTQEQLEVLIPDAEVSALLDAPTPTQHLKSKLASVVEAVDLDLLLDPHPSSFGHPAPVRAVASVAKSAATNLLLSTLQTGLSPRKSHQPIASGGAAPAAKKRLSDSPTVAAKKRLSDPQMVAAQKRLSDPQTVAASLQDPSMVRRAASVAGIRCGFVGRETSGCTKVRAHRHHHPRCAPTTSTTKFPHMPWSRPR